MIKSVYEKELIKSKSEIKALHSQIHPHFLFNTLDSLYWAHIRKGDDELAQMVIRLADMFRYSIQSSGRTASLLWPRSWSRSSATSIL